jgi:tetratricopeptide (TPR) repeat protein
VTSDAGEKRKVDSKQFFDMAERYYQKALEFQKRVSSENSDANDREEVAAGYSSLARLFRDVGKFKEAEDNFARAVEIRLKRGFDDSAAAALAEQGDFFRGQNRLDEAEAVYNHLIDFEEKDHDHEKDYDLADTYNELGEIQVAKGDTAKAEAVFRIGNLLQRTALKLHRKEKFQNPNAADLSALIKDLETDFDELGNAYIELGKLDNAEKVYLAALAERNASADDLEKRKSWDKLTKFYRKYKKDNANAEKYARLLVESYKVDTQTSGYADALVQLASLYSESPNKSSEVLPLFSRALDIYAQEGDWMNENVVIYTLGELYRKQKRVPDWENRWEEALRRRLATLSKYFNRLVDPAVTAKPKSSVLLVSEYLNAIEAVGIFSTLHKKDDEAEAAYRLAFAAFDYITRNIYNSRVLDFYARTLDGYTRVLNKLKKEGDAAKVAEKARGVREKLRQFDQISEQQKVQQIQQGASQPTAPQ